MTRPVRLSNLAALDLQQARDWFDQREDGLGDRFLASVEDTLDRIASNAEQYQVALFDLRRAPVKGFRHSLWYRVLPDESIVVAALSDRRPVARAATCAAPGGADMTYALAPCHTGLIQNTSRCSPMNVRAGIDGASSWTTSTSNA